MSYREYKNQAIRDLSKYNSLKASVEPLKRRIHDMQNSDLYRAPMPGQMVMGSNSADNKFIHHISGIENLESILRYNTLYIENIESALSCLMPKEKELLTGFYINRQRNTVTNLARKEYTERSWLYRKAQKALQHYIQYYFGVTPEDFEKQK